MTKNSFKDGLESDNPQLGAAALTCSPMVVETYGRIGLDFVWLDLEHSGISPTNSERIEELVRAAEVGNTELVVRITSSDPSVVRKVLDAGVRNIVIPRVKSPDEVKRAVKASKFEYNGGAGERGVGIGRANHWGEHLSSTYRQEEDESVMIGVNIENITAIQNLDEILSVPHLGFVLLGHQDLSVSMEALPQEEPVQDAIETYQRNSNAAGMPYGRSVGLDPDAVESAIENGYRMILIGDELSASRHAFKDLI